MTPARPGRAARLLRAVIRAYQLTVSPLTGPRCRFDPSCSAYAREALQVHGAGRGGLLALRRLLRCQPFCRGGWDPVPSAAENPVLPVQNRDCGPPAVSTAIPDAGPALLAGRGAHPC